ncbi:MAG: hypothetical protein HC800_21030 [Phormidesmis sp. RL_2_1]|nr:hypothetical protein [Phormidesmis sp. RL_2_1]
MVNQSSSQDDRHEATLTTAQAELLQAILATDSYPWAVSETADGYEAQLEAIGQALEISDAEALQGWQGLSQQLSQLWCADESAGKSAGESARVAETSRLQQKIFRPLAYRCDCSH